MDDATYACSNPGCTALSSSMRRFKRCSACKRAHYCSRACQKSHWKAHRAFCSARRSASARGARSARSPEASASEEASRAEEAAARAAAASLQPLPLSPDEAAAAVASGGTLLLRGLPAATEVGLDYGAWQIDDSFSGLKMLPPGLHLLFYALPADGGRLAAAGDAMLSHGRRVARFFFSKPHSVLALRWLDEEARVADEAELDAAQAERLAAGVHRMEFDRSLAAYPLRSALRWKALTEDISEAVAERCGALNGDLTGEMRGEGESKGKEVDASDGRASRRPATKKSKEQLRALREGLAAEAEEADEAALAACGLRFTPLPSLLPRGLSPELLTSVAMNRSAVLARVLHSSFGGRLAELRGEMALAFVAFLQAQLLAAFQQWKALLSLACAALEGDGMLADRDERWWAQEFVPLCRLLRAQLMELPADFFHGALSHRSFVRSSVLALVRGATLNRAVLPRQLWQAVRDVQTLCEERFLWELTAELAEDAPAIDWEHSSITPAELGDA